MKKLLLLVFALTVFQGRVNAQTVRIDTVALSRLSKLENDLYRLKGTNDSLNKELYFYRSKEDLYMGLFERYSTRTENLISNTLVIIGFGISLLGLISFTFLFQKFENRIKITERSLSEMRKSINSLGEGFVTQSKIIEEHAKINELHLSKSREELASLYFDFNFDKISNSIIGALELFNVFLLSSNIVKRQIDEVSIAIVQNKMLKIVIKVMKNEISIKENEVETYDLICDQILINLEPYKSQKLINEFNELKDIIQNKNDI